MKRNMSFKLKLMGLTIGLVLIPVGILSANFLSELGQFKQMSLEEAEKGITDQVKQTLQNGIIAARSEVENIVHNGEQSLLLLADSGSLAGYLESGSEAGNELGDFKEQIETTYHDMTVEVEGESREIFSHVRLLGPNGQERIKFAHGAFEKDLGNLSGKEWFREASRESKGQIYNSGVILSEDGDPELLMASPVYVGGSLKGLVAVNLKWSLVRSILAEHNFTDAGYAYIINNNGVVVSHPDYDFSDKQDLSSSQYGKLANVVSERMLAGESGAAQYSFQGTEQEVSFKPLHVGEKLYSMAVTLPVKEFKQPVRDLENRAEAIFSSQVRSLLIISGICIVLAILVGYFFSRRLSNQISRNIENLRESSRQLSSASNQLSSSSQKLAEGSSEQASSLEETSSSLEEMSSQTKQNADNASQADSAVRETVQQVESGAESVQRMSQAMEEIKSSTAETSRIIKTIDDIAFQTNLLALNAAVEAARAGEAGKGFAVVAEEVRNLAQRSSEAAQETSDLIEKSQTSANNGAQVAEEVASNLERIREGTERVKTLIGEISAASREQSQGIEQVNNAVSEMDKVVQQNASDAEESASAAEELDSQASELDRIVAHLTAFVHGENGREAETLGSMMSREVTRNPGGKVEQKRIGSEDSGQRSAATGETQQRQRDRRTENAAGRSNHHQADRMIPLDNNDSFKDF
jgi:hypothetical protein